MHLYLKPTCGFFVYMNYFCIYLPEQICCSHSGFPCILCIFQYYEWQITELFYRISFHFLYFFAFFSFHWSDIIVFFRSNPSIELSTCMQPDPSFMWNLWINLSGLLCYWTVALLTTCWMPKWNKKTALLHTNTRIESWASHLCSFFTTLVVFVVFASYNFLRLIFPLCVHAIYLLLTLSYEQDDKMKNALVAVNIKIKTYMIIGCIWYLISIQSQSKQNKYSTTWNRDKMHIEIKRTGNRSSSRHFAITSDIRID